MEDTAVRVLVADDESAMRALFSSILEDRGDCEVELACDGVEALEKLPAFRPDVLITDLNMPRLDGERLASRALALRPDLTVLVETGFPSVEGAVRLLKEGAFDFLSKPFSIDVLESRLDRAFDHSRRQRRRPRVDAAIAMLMSALGRRDPYLRDHGRRVGRLCAVLSQDLGLSSEDVKAVAWMGLVHDVGKIGIPDRILLKDGPLTDEEFALIREHPRFSAEIISPLVPLTGWNRALDGVLHHHERFDGCGYPDRLAGDDIPLESRIIAVCDAHDAMASHRPYQAGQPEAVVRANLRDGAGTQFDPEIVGVYLAHIDQYRDHVLFDL